MTKNHENTNLRAAFRRLKEQGVISKDTLAELVRQCDDLDHSIASKKRKTTASTVKKIAKTLWRGLER